ncbi:MAG: hypothetical protein IJR03_00200 [Bacteroidales bacterium]|nr:hypothetical protein [Bacteroidales bacterium]
MEKFRDKIFNEEIFEKYLKTLPSTKENALIKNGLFTEVNGYKPKMNEQTGGYAVVEPIKGRIGGDPVNYDGNTDIAEGTERPTFYQRKICFGRAKAWGEYDFSSDITGANFMAEAQEVKDYWDEYRQVVCLNILKGIFGMTGGVNGQFVANHTYEITPDANNAGALLTADGMNRAIQKALGDKKAAFDIVFMHSLPSTNLEGLNQITFLKYNDANGIQRDLTLGTWNGKLVVVDDDMPVLEGYEEATSATAGALKVVSSSPTEGQILLSAVKASDFYPADVAANDYVVASSKYVSYVFQKGFFEHEDIGAKVPSEIYRDARTKGGKTDLITRIREMIVPKFISYKGTGTVSPTNANFATGSNWELANNGEESGTVYVDPKLIPVARIISRG